MNLGWAGYEKSEGVGIISVIGSSMDASSSCEDGLTITVIMSPSCKDATRETPDLG